jgi:type IV pilus assembly protein PilB
MANPPNLQGLAGLARRLVIDSIISEADGRRAQETAVKNKIPLVTYLVDNALADSMQVAMAASAEFGMPILDISAIDLTQAPVKSVDEKLINQHKALPIFKRGNRLFLAMSDPTNLRALDEIKFATNSSVEAVLVQEDRLGQAIEQAFSQQSMDVGGMDDEEGLEGLEFGDTSEDDDGGEQSTEAGNEDAPVVKFVNKVLLDALKKGASDIHFEPFEHDYRVRYRMDGMLKISAKPPLKMGPRIAARIKVMASLDIAERRLPQDGRIKLALSKTKAMDFRVSTCPTLFGEKVVMRVLDGSAAKLGIDKLGYEDPQRDLYLYALDKPYGMILVTGPTGSGKTVSLYTGLNILNTEGRNISTAEDPVEIRVPGINQVQMNPKKGMTFAAALRSFLRQDPDVIMVGEIRDLETAEIAIKAAQTGHMVLSTLHTNDAPQTCSRLVNMGIAPYNITSAVTLIIAQRLGRRLHDCKKPVDMPKTALLAAGFTEQEIADGVTIFDAVGCGGCTDGYKGRVGIYQVMPMLEEIQKIILAGGNALQIGEVAKANGVNDLRKSARNKVRWGTMSMAEMNRITVD